MYYYHDLSGIATLKLDIEHTATCENNWYLLHIIGLGLRFGKFSFYIMKKGDDVKCADSKNAFISS